MLPYLSDGKNAAMNTDLFHLKHILQFDLSDLKFCLKPFLIQSASSGLGNVRTGLFLLTFIAFIQQAVKRNKEI